MIIDTLGKRLKHLRTAANLNQGEVAEKIGVSTSNISRIEKDEINPSASIVLQICKVFSVSADWVLMGEGEMLKGGEAKLTITPMSQVEHDLLSYFRCLEPFQQGKLYGEAKALVEREEELATRKAFTSTQASFSKNNDPLLNPNLGGLSNIELAAEIAPRLSRASAG
jgi:transcriptional regulator with XRE-family HTH domain